MSYTPCPLCGFAGEPTREYRATEKIYSCQKCGTILLRAPFPLDNTPVQPQAVTA